MALVFFWNLDCHVKRWEEEGESKGMEVSDDALRRADWMDDELRGLFAKAFSLTPSFTRCT